MPFVTHMAERLRTAVMMRLLSLLIHGDKAEPFFAVLESVQ